MTRTLFAAMLLAGALPAHAADTPQGLVAHYAAEAARDQAGFSADAARGARLYRQRFGVAVELPSCATCHTDEPTAPGKHALTGKPIEPLAPRANDARLTNAKKVEKWLRRNCTEVVGRECSAAEKADFLQFLASR